MDAQPVMMRPSYPRPTHRPDEARDDALTGLDKLLSSQP